jgi:deazaflavin-dependent oxidoreductase (nitroreductase family)
VARRYLKPGFLVSRVLNPLLMKLGLVPTLAVRGRRSGEWRRVPVNVLELDGQRYLVAPRGDTQWARNLRAAERGEIRTRHGAEPFTAVEVPDAEKPRIIDAYVARWGGQVKAQFRELPDPAEHPVFRIAS